MRDKYTSRPRGFGFLTLRDEDAAARICEETHVLDGRQVSSNEPTFSCHALPACLMTTGSRKRAGHLQIDAKRSMPQNQKPKMRKLFVGGLAPETTEGTWRSTDMPSAAGRGVIWATAS